MTSRRIATHTLGCKLNFAETSHLLNQFRMAGWKVVDFNDEADLYVVNTCTVTAVAEKKCRNAIRQAVSANPEALVAVIGCFAQNASAAIAKIEGVDIILGNDRKHRLLEVVGHERPEWFDATSAITPERHAFERPGQPTEFQLSYSQEDRTRTFFKIQDGCDYFCSYCAIPFARGRSRSATVEETINIAKEIAAGGAKEVVLTGVNTGTFGQDHGENLLQLLQELDKIESIERYRISSIEPNLLTNEIVDFVAHSRAFLPHFHIPLQAGSDKVLKLMHRRYDTAFYAHLLEHIKAVMPDACLAADIMAGFNGEDEATFKETIRYIESLPISYLHVFTFSERPNTAALKMDGRIEIHQRREHSRVLHEISERKKMQFYSEQTGRTRPVLWESDCKDDMMYGFTDNYIRVRRPYNAALVNHITPFVLEKLNQKEEVFDGK